jgi:ATP-dependent RNA helicase DeaD
MSMPDIETPADPFAQIPEPLAAAIRRRGFDSLTPVQLAVLDAESEGRDLRISSQTGSGKTLALGLALAPQLMERDALPPGPNAPKGPSALVIVPTRELAAQVHEELRWLYERLPRVFTEVVTGGSDQGRERRGLARAPAIVVGTPGRMLDHIRSGTLDCGVVHDVVLDEADRMLDMGFKEELEAILEGLPKERRSHLVSATFPSSLRGLADRFQKQALHLEGTRLGAAHDDIEHVGHVVRPRDAYLALVNQLLLLQGDRCLVFVQRRIDAAQLAERLGADGFAVQAFSGELAQTQRTRTLEAFRNGTLHTLISTDVAARGIDVPDISAVVHYAPPFDAESYVHRSGRTGRAGRKGRSVLLVPAPAQQRVRRALSSAKVDVSWEPAPSAQKVRKSLEKKLRAPLHKQLDDAEAMPSERRLAYAAKLLEDRDPAHVVATLLDMATPALPCQPRDLEAVDASSHAARPNQGFVQFSMNWGERDGATPSRILSHVCRRGEIKSRIVGSIQVGPRNSTFEIAGTAATRFEKLTRKPDARDPRVKIDRSSSRAPERAGKWRRPSKPHAARAQQRRPRGPSEKPAPE